jgi:flagellar operon protein (TIGR03826 family)
MRLKMDIRNCKSCNKLFNYISGPSLCPHCKKILEDKFAEIKEYIYDNPGADMQDISEKFKVPVSQIKQWIREERLSFSEDSMIGLECERCGTLIKTGRYCKACKEKLAKGFIDLYQEEKPEQIRRDFKENPKMRFLDQ